MPARRATLAERPAAELPVSGEARSVGVDLAGVLILGAALAWTLVCAAAAGGDAGPQSMLLLAVGGTTAGAALIARASRSLVPMAVAGAAGLVGVLALSEGGQPLGGVLGYANANAAVFAQGAVAALMLAAAWRNPWARAVAVGGSVAFVALTLVARSIAAAGLVLVLPVVALSILRAWGARAAIGTCAGLFLAALVATVAIGAAGTRLGPPPDPIGYSLSQLRLTLWHESFVIMRSNPSTGVGPGRFSEVSPTARADRDARWAHHGFLQQGAETGVPGMVLLVALFLWGFARLWATGSKEAGPVLGAAALAILGIHATVDYVLHFPVVTLGAAALVGAAVGGARR